jgi:hypothetical protein
MSQVTLEEVAKQFGLWRATRPHPGATPDYLKKLVQQLILLYPKSEILRSLKIGGRLFLTLSTKSNIPHNNKIQFTPIKLLDDLPPQNQHSCQITSKNGATMLITTQSPEAIIKYFLCYS